MPGRTPPLRTIPDYSIRRRPVPEAVLLPHEFELHAEIVTIVTSGIP